MATVVILGAMSRAVPRHWEISENAQSAVRFNLYTPCATMHVLHTHYVHDATKIFSNEIGKVCSGTGGSGFRGQREVCNAKKKDFLQICSLLAL